MIRPALFAASASALALALAGCEAGDYSDSSADREFSEAPAATDNVTETVAEEALPPAAEPVPAETEPLPEPAAGEESVRPESETLFY